LTGVWLIQVIAYVVRNMILIWITARPSSARL